MRLTLRLVTATSDSHLCWPAYEEFEAGLLSRACDAQPESAKRQKSKAELSKSTEDEPGLKPWKRPSYYNLADRNASNKLKARKLGRKDSAANQIDAGHNLTELTLKAMALVKDIFNVEGLVVVVTGAGSGIGLMMARALEANGAATVYIVGRRMEALEAAVKHSKHGRMVALQGDVTSKADLQRIADEVKARTGYINVLIANAGISGPPSNDTNPDMSITDIQSYLWQPSFEDMLSVYGANVLGVYFATVAFLELLHLGNQASNVVQRSQVITTSSISGFNRNVPHGFAYSSSKAAVTHLMKQMATFLAPHGIRSNLFAPGIYPSEMTNAKVSYETHEIPERRTGGEDDIAGAILFLASRAGGYCNGNVLVSDGGRLSVNPATY